MNPKTSRVRAPAYRRHKASGQAIVSIDRRDFYLGRYGSKASRREYERIVGEWLAAGRRLPAQDAAAGLNIGDLALRYWGWAESYYVKDGQPTSEQHNIRVALRRLNRLYESTLAIDFGPLRLKAFRETLIGENLSRKHVNETVSHVRRMFRWGVSNELVPAETLHALQAVDGLKLGRSEARETEPVRPVADDAIDAVRPFVSRQVWAMVELQRLTGMRPGEVVLMRATDIDTSRPTWEYRPARHKTQHHAGHERVIPLGPRARAIIEPFLMPDTQAYLFRATDADAERRERIHGQRMTPVQPSQQRRHERSVRRMAKGQRGRAPGDRYTTASYGRAIARACEMAWPPQPPLARREDETMKQWKQRIMAEGLASELKAWRNAHRWHPHQIRHSVGTRIRREYGIEAARVALGHNKLSTTEIYAEKNLEIAREIANRVG